jgi:hypothetical protein
MARSLLIRGMLCGLAAGLVVFLFARWLGEPAVNSAIGVEEALAHAAAGPHEHEPELVSRAVQAGWGLFTGTMVYSIALGGLFALAFALCWGRVGRLGARPLAALLAGAGFVAVYLVPYLKYPANPPSVGMPETIGYRTALYFGMIVLSIAAMAVAFNLGRSLVGRLGRWYAGLAGAAAYVVLIAAASLLMPSIDEVPQAFPATLLWDFRLVALGMQAILWTILGLGFGELAERAVVSSRLTAALRRP